MYVCIRFDLKSFPIVFFLFDIRFFSKSRRKSVSLSFTFSIYNNTYIFGSLARQINNKTLLENFEITLAAIVNS